MRAQKNQLSENQWHFQHGPIDLVIQAEGPPSLISECHQRAWLRFEHLLSELVQELTLLKTPIDLSLLKTPSFSPDVSQRQERNPCQGPVARAMWQSASVFASPLPNGFVTPMVCVAGAVAQEMLRFYDHEDIERAWINNGGDIALHLSPHTHVDIGVVTHPERTVLNAHQVAAFQVAASQGTEFQGASHAALSVDGQFRLHASSPSRGVATSGWRGRSFSFGIADAVTVLAKTASQADAAASIIANAVNIDHPGIIRQCANELKDDTDLGARRVTTGVPWLSPEEVCMALEHGVQQAQQLSRAANVHHVFLCLQGQVRYVDLCPPMPSPPVGARTRLSEQDAIHLEMHA